MKKYMKKAALAVLAGTLCMSGLTACGSKDAEAQEETAEVLDVNGVVAEVAGEQIPLGVLSFMAHYQQMQTELMYQSWMGMSAASMWDQVIDEETGQTYGEQSVSEILDQLEILYLMRLNAPDYDVELTEEENSKIQEVAEAFVEANGEEVLTALGTDQASIEEFLELITYEEKMYDPIVADIDREVSDEEAQQTSITYVKVELPEEEDAADEDGTEEDADTEEDTDTEDASEEEDTAVAEENAEDAAAEEDTEGTEDAAEDEAAADEDKEAQKDLAQQVLDQMLEDPEADMDEIASGVDESLSAVEIHYSANDELDTTVPQEVKDALADLEDGELAEEVVEAEDGFYVVRLDQRFDEEATEEAKESTIKQRESDKYTEVTEGWLMDAQVSVDESIMKKVKITSDHTFTIVTPAVEEETTEEETEETTEAEEDIEESAEETEETEEEPEVTQEAEEASEETEE